MDERNNVKNLYDFNIVLQCTNIEFYSRIEELFEPGMTWKNYGDKPDDWTVEYIIPLTCYDTYKDMLVFQTNEGNRFITIEDMCMCVNIRPVWNYATKHKRLTPSYNEVIDKCYEIFQFKDSKKQLHDNYIHKSQSSPNLNMIVKNNSYIKRTSSEF